MRFTSICREAYRNIITGTSRLFLLTLLLAVPVASFAVADLLQIRSFTDAARDYQRSGASVAVLDAPGHVDGSACDALNRIPGVRAAGAIRAEAERLTLATLPGAPVPVSTVTPGIADVLRADLAPGTGVYLSDQVADVIQTAPGAQVATPDGAVRVAGVYDYPNDGRAPGYGYMALVPVANSGTFDACWADIWPQSESTQAILYTALTNIADDTRPDVTLGQLNATLGARFAGTTDFTDRITRFAPIATGILALALGYTSLRIRRLEIASNLHAGISRRDQRSILLLESFIWILVSLALAEIVIAITIAADHHADRSALLLIAQRPVLAALLGAGIGTTLAWLSTREQHLFDYFKRR